MEAGLQLPGRFSVCHRAFGGLRTRFRRGGGLGANADRVEGAPGA